MRRRKNVLLVLGALVLLLGILLTRTAPYYQVEPGPTFDTVKALNEQTDLPDKEGSALVTTVNVSKVSYMEYLQHKVDPKMGVIFTPRAAREVDMSRTQKKDMITSQTYAYHLAISKTTNTDAFSGAGARVVSIDPKSSSAKAGFIKGDVIKRVDGRLTSNTTSANELLRTAGLHKVSVLRFASSFLGEETELDMNMDASTQTGLGLQTALTEANPYPLDTKEIGGPSGGLIFTLSYINAFSRGDLFTNKIVAGTGVIDETGQVRPIAGVAEKALAADHTHASIFFVPAANEKEARTAAPNLNVVPVKTYEEALRYLCRSSASEVC